MRNWQCLRISDLRSRLLVFMNDHESYCDRPVQEQLSSATYPLYLTVYHFKPGANRLHPQNTPTNESVPAIQAYAAQTLVDKAKLCSSHELFPLFVEVFEVSKSEIQVYVKAVLKGYE